MPTSTSLAFIFMKILFSAQICLLSMLAKMKQNSMYDCTEHYMRLRTSDMFMSVYISLHKLLTRLVVI
jgi:hypothetical protein